ncbi:MAG: cob(I)yrinic acid a,c-diamide adenosyltransferase [Candidatus Omnitrophica bacterium]|nr:cob(I)yrinic acid a,c-diamide adenosyltransferase [Candidatus Omnitrophota bacterium]
MIQIYTGEGKGKTTAALGLALRAIGAGLKVYIGQFAKGKECCGLKALKCIKKIKIEHFGSCNFIRKVTEKDKQLAQKGLDRIKAIISDKSYDMVIMDELNVALDLKLLKLDSIIELIKKAPPKIELIITGRNAHKKIIALADLVSEIKEIKHYYKKGVKARRGIEF